MPKKIEVLVRTLPYDNKLLGKGGHYPVSDSFAKQAVVDGKAKIIEDLGEDATPQAVDKKIDFEFMAKIKHHAPEIMKIMEEEFKRQREIEIADEKYQEELAHLKNSEEDQSTSAQNETGSESEKTEKISTSSENTVPSDELGGIVTTADNSSIEQTTPIPEDFPGFTALSKKGITTMEQLSALGYDDLIELGIRQGTATQIGAKLMELKNSNA